MLMTICGAGGNIEGIPLPANPLVVWVGPLRRPRAAGIIFLQGVDGSPRTTFLPTAHKSGENFSN